MKINPIADLLTRIRNALMVGKPTVDMPASNLRRGVLEILIKE